MGCEECFQNYHYIGLGGNFYSNLLDSTTTTLITTTC